MPASDNCTVPLPRQRRLWIGGSSGLARTYWNAFHSTDSNSEEGVEWIFVGLEKQTPAWLINANSVTYYSLDLRYVGNDEQQDSSMALVLDACQGVLDVVVGVRPRLVSQKSFAEAWNSNQQMIYGLEILLRKVLEMDDDATKKTTTDRGCRRRRLLHISSIAAVHHVREQRLRSEHEKDPVSEELENPYDRFKRATEEMVSSLAAANNAKKGQQSSLKVTNIRMGAIFSDDKRCIQCNAMQLQSRISCYLNVPIDCNSSRNVASLIHLMLIKSPETTKWTLRPIYYYTRPIRYHPQPVPYGFYLAEYRRAHDISTWTSIWIPVGLVHAFVGAVHWFAMNIIISSKIKSSWWSRLLGKWLYLEHVDYLLQVTLKEHSFDLTAIQADFPMIVEKEESIYDCFRRRRKMPNL